MDSIWFLMNKIVYESYRPTIESFVSGTLKTCREHKYAWGNKQLIEPYNGRVIAGDHYILSFDVAVRNTGSTTAAICRASDGSPIFVKTKFIQSQNPNQGEATAMLIGIEEAIEHHIKKITIIGDSLVAIKTVEDPDDCPDWSIEPIAKDTSTLLQSFESWNVRKIHRDHNRSMRA